MNEKDLRIGYEKRIAALSRWGNHVQEIIINRIAEQDDFELQIPAAYRVKNIDSFIGKALYRKKNYDDPLLEITDQVGVRFIVLLLDQIPKVTDIIEKELSWQFSKDRDYEEEKLENPTIFTYQSMHYVVRGKAGQVIKEEPLDVDVACEIQVRTLLQHAYSEMAHDTIYKPRTKAHPKVHRLLARSMAHIETTDELFKKAVDYISEEAKEEEDMFDRLVEFYNRIGMPRINSKINSLILDSYKDEIREIDATEIEKFLEEKEFIKEIILTKKEQNFLYAQPVILLLYYLIEYRQKQTKRNWPLTLDELSPMFRDLGLSPDPQ